MDGIENFYNEGVRTNEDWKDSWTTFSSIFPSAVYHLKKKSGTSNASNAMNLWMAKKKEWYNHGELCVEGKTVQ